LCSAAAQSGAANEAVQQYTTIEIPMNDGCITRTIILSLSVIKKIIMGKLVESQIFGIKEIYCPPIGVGPEIE
jgi:hypothetical protein